MKVLLKCLSSGLVLLSLAACAYPTTANYEKLLNSWIGDRADNLISSWGPPQNTSNLSDGGRVLAYINSSSSVSYNSTLSEVTGIHTFKNNEQFCKTLFTVNSNGIITRATGQGNACRS